MTQMSCGTIDDISHNSEVAHEAASDSLVKTRKHFLQVWTLVGACALVAIASYLLNVLAIPVGIIVWTVIICFILAAPVDYLQKHGISRIIGTLIAFVLLFAVLAILGVVLFSPAFGVSDQFSNLIASVPDFVQSLSAAVNTIYEEHIDILQNDQLKALISNLMDSFASTASSIASTSASSVISVGTSFANTLLTLGFAFVVAFWMLIELPQLRKEISRLVSDEHRDDATMLYVTFTRVMGGFIKGTLFQCAIIGVACGIMFAIIGTPNPAALGLTTGLLNIIPVIGPWLGGAVAALSCLFTSPIVALIALAGTIAIQQAVYMIVSPRIMGDAVDIHPAITFIALMAGSAIGGEMTGTTGALVGALLAIPAVAAAKSIFVYYFEKKTGRRLAAKDGVFFRTADAPEAPADPIKDATGYSLDELEHQRAEAESIDKKPSLIQVKMHARKHDENEAHQDASVSSVSDSDAPRGAESNDK